MAMKVEECLSVLKEHWRDELVICSAGTSSAVWWELTQSRTCFYMEASIGIASMFALGLAIGLPQARVWCIEGDGSVVFNPGVFLAEGQYGPPNLRHFVLVNRVWGATGSLPYPGSQVANLAAMAEAAGVKRVAHFSDLEQFSRGIGELLSGPGFALAFLEVESEPGKRRPPVPIDGPEQKYLFARHIEERYGVKVFGEEGY